MITFRSPLAPAGRAAVRVLHFLGLACLPALLPAQDRPASPDDEVVALKPFQVTAEGGGGYKVSSASTATRTNRPLIEIPQTVDIITSEFWADIGATMADESISYVANAYVRDRSSSTDGRGINMRGFENNDSFTTDGVRINGYKRNLAGYERLEIVKGPSAAVQGRAGGTGLFNYILKKPGLGKNAFTAKLTTGFDEYDHSFNQGEFDADYTLNDARTLGARVVAVRQKSDDYIDFQGNSITALYPSFRWRVRDRTEIVLVNEIIRSQTPARELGHGFGLAPAVLRRLVPQFAAPTDPVTSLNLPRTFNLIGPDSPLDEELYASTLFVNHQFTDSLYFRLAAHRRYLFTEAKFFGGENNLVTSVSSPWTRNLDWRHNTTIQGDFVYNLRFRGLNSSTMFGYTYADSDNVADDYAGTPDAPFNFLDLVALARDPRNAAFFNGRKVSNAARTSYRRTDSSLAGLYVHETLGLWRDRIIFSGGVRRDTDKSESVNLVTGAPGTPVNTTLTSPQYGVTFKVKPRLAVYAISSIQNDPTRDIARWGGLLAGDPRIQERMVLDQQITMEEFGLKTEVFDGRLTLSACYFDMTRTGATATITQEGITQGQARTITEQVEVKGATSRGLEIQAFGSITPRFNLMANFTRMETSQANAATPDPDDRIALRFAPEWNLNFFGKYSFRDGRQNGWLVKGGVSLLGPLYLQVTNVGLVHLDKVQRSFDAGVAYRRGRYEVDFMVRNLTDDVVMVTRDNAPRNYRLSLTARF